MNNVTVRELTKIESLVYRVTDDLPNIPVSPELAKLIAESIKSSQKWVADTATKGTHNAIR